MGQGRGQHGNCLVAPAVLAREGGSQIGEGGREGGRKPRVTMASRELQHMLTCNTCLQAIHTNTVFTTNFIYMY